MPCYSPIIAYRSKHGPNPVTGKVPLVFNMKEGIQDDPVTLPCGQCIGCRLERSRQWAIRCVHEASLYDRNCFITLTYSPEHIHRLDSVLRIPDCVESVNRCLDFRGDILYGLSRGAGSDIEYFLKRLRRRFGEGIRFFQCGEYGEDYGRPHHHALLFNFDFPDKEFWRFSNGLPLFRSPWLESKEGWPYGFSAIGDLTFESAAYVARYVTKKITGDRGLESYFGREPEFITMSRRPGIAHGWFDKFYRDVYSIDSCVIRTFKGTFIEARPPKYYDMLYDLQDSDDMCRIKGIREHQAACSEHNSSDRLKVRRYVHEKNAARLVRNFEKDGVIR